MLRNLQHFLRLAVMGRVVGVLPHLLVLSAGQQAGVVGDDALNAGQVRRCKSRAKVAAQTGAALECNLRHVEVVVCFVPTVHFCFLQV